MTVFDLKYINDKMLGGLRRASGKIEDYCKKLAVKAFSMSQVGQKGRSMYTPNKQKKWMACDIAIRRPAFRCKVLFDGTLADDAIRPVQVCVAVAAAS